jgi:hypothetical protein
MPAPGVVGGRLNLDDSGNLTIKGNLSIGNGLICLPKPGNSLGTGRDNE